MITVGKAAERCRDNRAKKRRFRAVRPDCGRQSLHEAARALGRNPCLVGGQSIFVPKGMLVAGRDQMQGPIDHDEYSKLRGQDLSKVAVELRADAHRPARPLSSTDNWVQLQQNPEAGESGSGYYTYGKMPPGMSGTKADYQWGEPRTMQVIQSVAGHLANGPQFTPFGVGNISLSGGRETGEHELHRDGRGIDVRPARKDGRTGDLAMVDYRHPDYDRAATRRLLEAFIGTGQVKSIWFNDPELYDDPVLKKYVSGVKGHDDHFHVQLLADE